MYEAHQACEHSSDALICKVWLQRPFKSEAPLLMEIFQQVFKGATAVDLAKAAAPVAPQHQPGQSTRANLVRPKGTAIYFSPIAKSKVLVPHSTGEHSPHFEELCLMLDGVQDSNGTGLTGSAELLLQAPPGRIEAHGQAVFLQKNMLSNQNIESCLTFICGL